MLEETASALAALVSIVDLGEKARNATSTSSLRKILSELTEKTLTLQQVLIAVQQAHATQAQIQAQQENLIVQLQKKIAERGSYELHEVTTGSFVYVTKPAPDTDYDPPYFCQPCMDNADKKSVFRQTKEGPGINGTLQCPDGGKAHQITLRNALPLPPQPPRKTSPFERRDW